MNENEQERNCNSCHWYDPESGSCIKKGEFKKSYDGTDCEDWVDWEGGWG